MKKLLLLSIIAVGLVACNPKSDVENAANATTEAVENTADAAANAAEGAVDGTKEAITKMLGIEVPTFENPQVQSFVDEYTAFLAEGKKDGANLAQYKEQFNTEWMPRIQELAGTLKDNPEEEKKFMDFVTKAGEVLNKQ